MLPSYLWTSTEPATISGGAGGCRGCHTSTSSATGGGGGGGDGWGESSVTRPQASGGPTSACELIRCLVKVIRFSYMVMSERTCASSSRSACPVVSSS